MRQEEKRKLMRKISEVMNQLADSEHQEAKVALSQAIAAISEIEVEENREMLPAWKIINYSLVQGEVAKRSETFIIPNSFQVEKDNYTWGVNNAFHWGETFYNKDEAANEYINHLDRMRENLKLISRSTPARADKIEPSATWIWAKDEITFVPVMLFRGTDLNKSTVRGVVVIPIGNGLVYKNVLMDRDQMFSTLFDAMKQ